MRALLPLSKRLAGRRRVEARFALAVYVERYLEVLREVAALPRSTTAA